MIFLQLQDIWWLSICPNQIDITTKGSDEYDWKSTLRGRLVHSRDLKSLSLKKTGSTNSKTVVTKPTHN
jgi:hypothetical protein